MENDIVLERISNLKGRLGYEEKKAKKLGFASLYDYMEEKINSENIAMSREGISVNKPNDIMYFLFATVL